MTDPGHIANWQRLAPDVTTSGALASADLAELAALGTAHVINLALPDHPRALPGEAEKLAALGLAYTPIPVPFGAPGEDHFAAFCAALEQGPRPVHVHCILNMRVSAFFYRWHTQVRGMAAAEARALLERQWNPDTDPQAQAPAWARFIRGG